MDAPIPPICHAFIPARYASTRFPGKPLADIFGKPMFWHVWSRASRCALLRAVTLCTDDLRIADTADSLGVPCIMTRADHQSGSDRIYEAAHTLGIPEQDVVVNIQGDEPALRPEMLDDLLRPFTDPSLRCATLAHPVSAEEAISPDRVKVVRDKLGNALYFSRSPIPFPRDGHNTANPYLLHIGLYAFRMETLGAFTSLPQSPLECIEKLEQLRLLENGIAMRVSLTAHRSTGVDSPADLETIKRIMQNEI